MTHGLQALYSLSDEDIYLPTVSFLQGLYDMEFAVMDATRLDNIPSLCFDLIVDKGEASSSVLPAMHVVIRE